MNKVDIAKMLGLNTYNSKVRCWEISELLNHEWSIIEWEFCDAYIIVCVDQKDLIELGIHEVDMTCRESISICIKQVEDLLWERAAEEYIKCVHKAAMLIGNV